MQFLIWKQLKVLLWKNLLLRKHHWTYGLIETIAPTIFMLVLHVFALEYDFMDRPKTINNTYNPQRQPKDLYKFFDKKFVILYTPHTNFTKRLISETSQALGVRGSNIKQFDNETEMNKYLRDYKGHKAVGLVFSNLSNDLPIPLQLHYVIRPYKYVYLTKDLFVKNNEIVTDTGSLDYFRNGFIPLKMALDTSYINMLGGAKDIKLVMQEFPYPPFYNEFINFKSMLPHWIFVSFIGFYVITMHKIVEEKESGSKQLMLSMGLQKRRLWLGWFLDTLLLVNLFSIFMVTCFLKFSMWGGSVPLIKYSNGLLLFAFLLVYTMAGTVFMFAFSSFVSKNTSADLIAFLVLTTWYILGMCLIFYNPSLSRGLKTALMLFPHFGLYFGFDAIYILEKRKIGLHLNNLFIYPDGYGENIEVGYVFLMFLTDIIIYFLITFLMENLNPGHHATSRTMDLLLKKFCTRKNSSEISETDDKIKFYKVERPPNLEVGVRIVNLNKQYGHTLAINNVTMDIYVGEVIALVGKNKAGKTTLMSIIAEMLSATSGDVYVQDRNIKHVVNAIKASTGYCDQHNLNFLSLTVKEHLVFFGILKGLSIKNSYKSANQLLSRLNLYEERHCKAYTLSDDLQRTLSLAIALIGNPKMLILDEPTFGLDAKRRRVVWEILTSMKSTRVIFISTQSIEEADSYADRIAVLHHGSLTCYGTSSFLKKEFGARYRLQITINEISYWLDNVSFTKYLTSNNNERENEIINTVQRIIPEGTFQSKVNNTLFFSLPWELKSEYSKLLEELNLNKFIKDIELKSTTIEEVYNRMDEMVLKEDDSVIADSFQQSDENETGQSFTVSLVKKQKKPKKIINHWRCLLLKKYLIEKKRWCTLLSGIFLIVIATILTLILTHNSILINDANDNFNFNLNVYGKSKVFYYGSSSSRVSDFKSQYKKLILNQTKDVQEVQSVSKAILQEGEKDIEFYKRYLIVAVEFNSTKKFLVVNAMYSNSATHGAPISLSLIMNTILHVVGGENYFIWSAINFSPFLFDHKNASGTKISIYWTVLLPLAFLIYCGRFLFVPLTEKRTKLKHLQLMCGVRSLLYWSICYIWDFFIYLLAVTIVILIVGFIVNLDDIFNKTNEIKTLFLILLAYGFSMISYIYVYSHSSVRTGSCFHFTVTCLAVSFLMGTAIYLVEQMEKFVKPLSCVFACFPQFGLFYCIFKFSSQAVSNYNLNNQLGCEDTTKYCRQNQSYLSGQNGICYQLSTMFASTFFYLIVMTILEARFTSELSEKRLIHNMNKNIARQHIVEDVHALKESDRVLDIFTREKRQPDEMLKMYKSNANAGNFLDFYLVNGVQKIYNFLRVVKGVSFGLNRGDCFGILGDTGSGKSTIFHLLTGISPVHVGGARIYANDRFYYLYKNYKKHLEFIGYCPQNNPAIEMLTGQEMLNFFAKIRGITTSTTSEVSKWINLLGLEDCADEVCRYYSIGNKRTLSVGIALIGSPLIVMLDEPTDGIDPVSRRKLWKVITTVQKQDYKPCIILSSKNVEECEALCNKMAILINGNFECFGTLTNLKEQFSKGFIIKIKLNIRSNNEFFAVIDDQAFKLLISECQATFVGHVTVKDKYSGLIIFHVEDTTIKWDDLFKKMDELQKKHTLIAEYDLKKPTLEDTFIAMTTSKEHHQS